MRIISFILFVMFSMHAKAQELFTFTEPASNMPAKSFAVRANNYIMPASSRATYMLAPELMLGLSKKFMLHAETFIEPFASGLSGGSLYGKYRFYSADDIHEHFRVAAFGKVAAAEMKHVQNAVDLGYRNSGAEVGLVATKLADKIALSAGASLLQTFSCNTSALAYSFSAGKLMLPREYKNFQQVNLNLMAGLSGQTATNGKGSYVDAAPSLQLIFQSRIRIDAGYRFPLINSLSRISDRSFLLRIEYNFFSVFK